jgi:hypothetical protein
MTNQLIRVTATSPVMIVGVAPIISYQHVPDLVRSG